MSHFQGPQPIETESFKLLNQTTTRTNYQNSYSRVMTLSQDLLLFTITSLSPFVIEKQIDSLIGTPKPVKKLKNKTLLVETSRKSQSDNLLKISSFLGIKVSVMEHKSLNSSKGIIRDRMLKGEKESEIVDYLKEQGVTACKRFTITKDHQTIETNTLLLTFNSVTVPKSLKIFYRIVPVDIHIPNPLRCFIARGLVIIRTIALSTWDLFVRTAVLEVTTTIPQPAKINPNA